MKLALIAFLFASPAFASEACKSVDEALARFNQGTATAEDVVEAALCRIETSFSQKGLCNTRIGLRQDAVLIMEARFQVGEVTRGEVDAARESLRQTQAICN